MADLVRQTLTGAGQIVLNGGLFFKLIQAGGPVDITFWFDGSTKRALQIEAGYQFGPLPEDKRFSRIVIASASAQTIVALVGDEFEDYERIEGVFQARRAATLSDAADIDVGGVPGPVLLCAPSSSRKLTTIKVNSGGSVSIRVGTQATVAAGRGIQLDPGQSYSFEQTDTPVYAIREAAGVAVVSQVSESF